MTKALQYILITITLTLGLASVSAAEKNNFQAPDFQSIKTETLNPDSKYYYPKRVLFQLHIHPNIQYCMDY